LVNTQGPRILAAPGPVSQLLAKNRRWHSARQVNPLFSLLKKLDCLIEAGRRTSLSQDRRWQALRCTNTRRIAYFTSVRFDPTLQHTLQLLTAVQVD